MHATIGNDTERTFNDLEKEYILQQKASYK